MPVQKHDLWPRPTGPILDLSSLLDEHFPAAGIYPAIMHQLKINNDKVHLILTRLTSLQWRHNGHDSVSNHQPHDCLLNRLFRRRSKKTSMLRVTGLCVENSPGTVEFPAQMVSNAENVSIGWRYHDAIHSWWITRFCFSQVHHVYHSPEKVHLY